MSCAKGNESLSINLSFTEAEKQVLSRRLWALLGAQAQRYTGGDSSSITIERAESLFESLSYTLSIAMQNGVSKDALLHGDMRELIRYGQSILESKRKLLRVEWELLCRDLPRIPNVYLNDTVHNLGAFFGKYDILYGAHLIPCSIDYPLMSPLPESLKGISYIERYITDLRRETDFIIRFDTVRLISLYKCLPLDYRLDCFNLCEAVLSNALGLAILGDDVHALNVTAFQRNELMDIIAHMPREELRLTLESSADDALRLLGMSAQDDRDFFTDAAGDMSERIFTAVRNNALGAVFISFE